MADIQSNTTNLSNLVPSYYSKRLLERLEPNSRLYQLGMKKTIPANSGKTIIWNRYLQLDPGMNLTEGQNPGPSSLSTEIVSCTLTQYGNLVRITDMVDMTAISDVVRDAVDILADNAATTVNKYIFSNIGLYPSAIGGAAALSAGAITVGFPALYSKTSGSLDGITWGNVASGGVLSALIGTPLTVSGVRKAVTHLRTLNVSTHEDGFYHAVATPEALDQLRGDSTWASWNQYQRPEKMERGLVGEVEGVKFYDDNTMKISMSAGTFSGSLSLGKAILLSGGNLNPVLVFGRGAYAVTELEGAATGENATKVYVVPRNSPDKNDPLQQFGYVGYKTTLAAQIINPSCGVIIATTVSDE